MSSDETRTWIRRASTGAGLAYTAIAEYELARRLGAEPYIAVMLPMSIDCYVIAALKWFKALDVAMSLVLMCAAQVAAHALEAGVVEVSLDLVVVVSVLVPVALWRTHALARGEEDHADPEPAEYMTVPEAEPVPVAPDPVRPVPVAVPDGARLLPIVARPAPAEKALALAAEVQRARAEVRAEYVPEVPPWESSKRELGWAAMQFRDEILGGQVPSIRVIKERLGVGQDKAKEYQDGFRDAVKQLAGATP
ncbi:hypothetical protein GTY65_19845 [Streptomyces sp. SID8379]|uniref:hypothetical protein n=1 Tax=unclassified Streptomyces TaxID=2593676 RepID=UPI00036FFF53|nr:MULTISPECIES: hypothetical protein [unclassified Streptomyces]MYW66288.1 hypothetical protein [Streptomyces sp. SID8379]